MLPRTTGRPELAGRDEQLDAFDIVLERVARGRPERSIVLTGLRGVGKTVLLNALRSAAVRAGWGTGKLEARPDQSLRRPLASALHQAVRELGPAGGAGEHALGVVKAFGQREVAFGRLQVPRQTLPSRRTVTLPVPVRTGDGVALPLTSRLPESLTLTFWMTIVAGRSALPVRASISLRPSVDTVYVPAPAA